MLSEFLSSRDGGSWVADRTDAECEFYIGEGTSALEVVVTDRDSRPTKNFLHRTYRDRRGNRPNPILIVALYDDQAALCGPSGEDPPVYYGADPGQAARVCDAALDRPDRLSAERFLSQTLPQLDEDLAGLRNQGLLSTHELTVGVPERDDWADATAKARDALGGEPRELIEELNYEIDQLTDQSSILTHAEDGRQTAIAIFLRENESFDHAQDRFVGTPVSYALKEAERENLDYVIGSNGDRLRLYTTNPDAGFGSRGRTDTYVEINTRLLPDEKAGYLWLLFAADALRPEGTLRDIMARSKDYATDLGARLRERIYDDVIPQLAESIAATRDLDDPDKDALDDTYEMAMVLLYRLLFIAYAEDEEFLPRRRNDRYDQRSLKQKAHDLHDLVEEGGSFDEDSTFHWDDVMQLTRAIHNGNDQLGLPEYDGRLLSSDPDISEAGTKLANIRLSDAQFGPVLVNLLIDETGEGYQGPVDFRNIGVREFGVVYEGLLESELSLAEQPLGTDSEGRYEPVDPEEEPDREIVAEEGQIYLHGQSGERKATGTYYTKTQFVEHLLDYSLDPALDEHIERLDNLDDDDAADAFFDLRVADIAMGSGHFLVGAVDRIESRLYSYLTERSLPGVEDELDKLEKATEAAAKTEEYAPTVERGQLLRRQVARRCVYGVDLNPLATELARLSLWVHTFVPGLPLTFLDYNLVTGDSLAGIGTLSEVSDILDVEQTSLGMFAGGSSVMSDLREDIDELGRSADTDAAEVAEARATRQEIERQLERTHAAFDILAASRIDDDIDPTVVNNDGDIIGTGVQEQAQRALESTDQLHFPAAFPEVFQGKTSGFDVIVGNPPWEKAKIERHEFWARHYPGLRGLTQTQREEKIEEIEVERPDLSKQFVAEQQEEEKRAKILTEGPYPGIGTGDPDMYLAFGWRFWALVQNGGKVGVVLPRSAFGNASSEKFRRRIMADGVVSDLTFLKNRGGWAFDGMESRYTIGLFSYTKQNPGEGATVPLRGPYPTPEAFAEGIRRDPYRFPVEQAISWTETATFPLLPPDPRSVDAFGGLSDTPNLGYNDSDDWRAVPNTELHGTQDKTADDGTQIMHFIDEPPEDFWPVYTGASFNIWRPDTGERYAWADPATALDYVQEKRERSYQYAGSRSPFSGMSEEWVKDRNTLPCLSPRVAYREVARATDSRTVIPSLVPPELILNHKAPYFLWPRGDEEDEAYLLGVLSSIPLDWYARRFVENTVAFYIVNALPVPRPDEDSRLRKRVISLAGRLAAVDDRYNGWASAIGVECGPLDENDKIEKIYELDAVVAHLYGLSREPIEVIFETFHEGWDYHERLDRVLDYYDDWNERLVDPEVEAEMEADDDD